MKRTTRNVRIHKNAKYAASRACKKAIAKSTDVIPSKVDSVKNIEKHLTRKRASSALRLIVLSLVSLTLISALLVSISVSWFMVSLESPGTALTTGPISLNFSSYKKNQEGTGLVRYLNCDVGSSASIDLYNGIQQKIGLFASAGNKDDVYFVIEKDSSSIDLDTKISFEIVGVSDGTVSDYIGGFNFQLSNITDEFENLSGTLASVHDYTTNTDRSGNDCTLSERRLQDYIYNYAFINSGTEYSLNTISGENGTAVSTDLREGNVCVYRLTTYLKDEAANDPRYTGVTFGIRVYLQAGQQGAVTGGDAQIYEIPSYSVLNDRIADLTPGDTLVLTNNIEYNGDLIFNLPVNLVLGEYDLTVNGNVIFTSTYAGQFSIDTSDGGQLNIQKVGNSGGKLEIDSSKSSFTINGKNDVSFTDISVAGSMKVRCSIPNPENYADASTDCGFTVNGAYIRNGSNLQSITVCDNTRVNITAGTKVGALILEANAEVFSLINEGEIASLDMSAMSLVNAATLNYGYYCGTLHMPQIFVDNFGTIGTLTVPSASLKFVKSTSGCIGNTRIIAEFDSTITTFNGTTIYTVDSIESVNENVNDVYGDGSYLIIYYKDLKNDDGVTINLNEIIYGPSANYEGYLEKTERSSSSIVNIKIIGSAEEALDSSGNDYATLRTLSNLHSLDLSEITTKNNLVPTNAFSGLTALKNLKLPKGVTILKNNIVSSTAVVDLYLPESVTEIKTAVYPNALDGVLYVHPEYNGIVTGLRQGGDRYIFVPESQLSAYRSCSEYSSCKPYIFEEATLSDNGNYFYRKQSAITADFVVWVGSNEAAVNLTQLKTISPTASSDYQIISFDDYAFKDKIAFANHEIDLELGYQLKNIGAYAFDGCTSLSSLKIESAVLASIGENAFRGCTGLVSVSIGSGIVYTVKDGSQGSIFDGCTNLSSLKLNKIQKVSSKLLRNSNGSFLLNLNSLVIENTSKVESSALYISGSNNVSLNDLTVKNTALIEREAFRNCTNLYTVYLDGVDEVGNSAFMGCINLKIASAPETTTIDSQIFKGCTALEVVSFPKVQSGTLSSFLEGCTALKIVDIGMIQNTAFSTNNFMQWANLPYLKLWIIHTENLTSMSNNSNALSASSSAVIVINSEYANKTGNVSKVSSAGVNTASLCWADSVSTSSSAIRWSVSNGTGIKYLSDFGLGDYLYCVNGNTKTVLRCLLEEIIETEEMPNVAVIGETIEIGTKAFINQKCHIVDGQSQIPTLYLPDSVTSIGNCAFYNSQLYKVEGNNVLYIGGEAFKDNSNLRCASFEKCNELGYTSKTTLAANRIIYSSYIFSGCTKLSVLEIGAIDAIKTGNSTSQIAYYLGVLYDCSNFKMLIMHTEHLDSSFNQDTYWLKYIFYTFKNNRPTPMTGVMPNYKLFINNSYYTDSRWDATYVKPYMVNTGMYTADNYFYATENNEAVKIRIDNDYYLSSIGYGEYLCGANDDRTEASLIYALINIVPSSVTNYCTPSSAIYKASTIPIREICSNVYKEVQILSNTLNISENTWYIQDSAFEGQYTGSGASGSLKSITAIYLNNVKTLGNNVFRGIQNIQTVDIGSYLENLGTNTFCDSYNSITTIKINSTKHVTANSLFGNHVPKTNLTVEVPSSVYFEYYYYCNPEWGHGSDSTIQSGIGPATATGRAHFVIRDQFYTFGGVEYAFETYREEISDEIGYKITNIAIPASGISSLIIPSFIPQNGITSSGVYYPVLAIGDGAFSQLNHVDDDHTDMISISLPEHLLSLSSDNFEYVPVSVQNYCVTSQSIASSEIVSNFAVDSDGILYSKDYKVLVSVPASASVGSSGWANTIEVIGTNAFINYESNALSFNSNSSILVMSKAFGGNTLATVVFDCPVILLSQSFYTGANLEHLYLNNTSETSKFLATDCISSSTGYAFTNFKITVPSAIYSSYVDELIYYPDLQKWLEAGS